jgi:hypothetical protein
MLPSAAVRFMDLPVAVARQCNRTQAGMWAALAQLVEHIIRNDGVGCSNHPSGTTFCYLEIPFTLDQWVI